MKSFRAIFLGLVLTFGAGKLCATGAISPKETSPLEEVSPTQPVSQPAYSDSFIYALVHASTNHLYNLGTDLLRSFLTSKVASALVNRQESYYLSEGKFFVLGTVKHLLWVAALWGRYKLPDVVNRVLLGKKQEHSDSYKVLSLANRSQFGFKGAFVESFLENEFAKAQQSTYPKKN